MSPSYANTGAWNNTGAAARRKCVTSKLSEAFEEVTTNTDSTTGLRTHLLRQYVSDPLSGPGTLSGTVTGQIRCRESNGSANAYTFWTGYVVSNDGATVRGLIGGGNPNLSTHEFATTLTNRVLTDSNEAVPFTIQNVDYQNGDRVVVEVGFVESTTNTTYTVGMEFGDNSASDLPGSGNLSSTDQYCPWIEFSQTLAFQGSTVSGAVDETLGECSVEATATVEVAAAAAVTLGAATVSSAATVSVSGSLSSTLGAATLAGTGNVGSLSAIEGVLSVTLDAATLSASATHPVSATLSGNLGAATLSAPATVLNRASLSVTLSPATLAGSASTVIRLGIIGDSDVDEYRADDNRGGAYSAVTFSGIESLARLRPAVFNLGPWGTRSSPRRIGYEYNWARSGAALGDDFNGTHTSIIAYGMHTGLAAQVAAGLVDTVLISGGGNDFHPTGGTYADVYDGTVSGADLTAKVDSIIANVTTAVDAVLTAGAARVILLNVPDPGPYVTAIFPNATYRQRVTDAIVAVNAGLTSMAASRPTVALVNRYAWDTVLLAEYPLVGGYITVGGEPINWNGQADEPHNRNLSDAHFGTIVSALLWGNQFVIDVLNSTFGMSIAPLSDAEILAEAGIVVGRNASLNQTLGPVVGGGAATVAVSGSLTATLGTATVTAEGVVGNLPITGLLSVTLGDATLSAAAGVEVVGAASQTLGVAGLSGTANVSVSGSLSVTLGPATLYATTTPDVQYARVTLTAAAASVTFTSAAPSVAFTALGEA